MAEIRWTLQAASDLESIAEYIALDSAHYASLSVMDMLSAVERLADFPESGRIVPEYNQQDIREILFGSYRIIYRIRTDLVEIFTVYHGARLLNPDRGG